MVFITFKIKKGGGHIELSKETFLGTLFERVVEKGSTIERICFCHWLFYFKYTRALRMNMIVNASISCKVMNNLSHDEDLKVTPAF